MQIYKFPTILAFLLTCFGMDGIYNLYPLAPAVNCTNGTVLQIVIEEMHYCVRPRGGFSCFPSCIAGKLFINSRPHAISALDNRRRESRKSSSECSVQQRIISHRIFICLPALVFLLLCFITKACS